MCFIFELAWITIHFSIASYVKAEQFNDIIFIERNVKYDIRLLCLDIKKNLILWNL